MPAAWGTTWTTEYVRLEKSRVSSKWHLSVSMWTAMLWRPSLRIFFFSVEKDEM
jgi:hypothetical protein